MQRQYDPQELNDENCPHNMNRYCMALLEPYTLGIHGDNLDAVGHFLIRWIPTREECMEMMENRMIDHNGREVNLDLVKPYLLETGELCGLRKTNALRRVQRRWHFRYRVRYEPFHLHRTLRDFNRRIIYGCVRRTNLTRD